MWGYKNPVLYADLRRILVAMRCELSEADVMGVVVELLNVGMDREDVIE